jgi:crossover junction endodeoxyribonuclease RuvC
MSYLGLDLSLTATGFYLITEDKPVFMEIKTKPEKFPNEIARVDYIADVILENIKKYKVKFIALEDFFSGQQAMSVIKLAILGSIVRYRLLEAGYSYLAVAPTQIKKFETGKGVAPKDNMLKSVFKKHGFDTNSNNIADACAIAHLGKSYCEYLGGKRDFAKYELEVLKKIEKEREIIKPYK